MKLAFIHLCGFRGYQKAVQIEFSDSFTIIDGRNGAGKSTIFDAIEFALTGTISKYLDATADRESVENYLWWTGEGAALSEQFVKVGFRLGEETFTVERTPLSAGDEGVEALLERLIERESAPSAPKTAVKQLCTSTIIRDEHIARMSLDMKETERFTMLREAIGAPDAEQWTERARDLTAAASTHVKMIGAETERTNQTLTTAIRQIDQARAALPAESLVNQATQRLKHSLHTSVASDQLPDVVRRRLVAIGAEIDKLAPIATQFKQIDALRPALTKLEEGVRNATSKVTLARSTLDGHLAGLGNAPASTALTRQARQLDELVNIGRLLDLRNGHCPLCESAIDHIQFENGLQTALGLARQLDAQAVDQAAKERLLERAREELGAAERVLKDAVNRRDETRAVVDTFDKRLGAVGLSNEPLEKIEQRISELELERQAVSADLRLVDTGSLNQAIVRATQERDAATKLVASAEGRLARARIAETRAKAIFDAARRATAETLDRRLERVLPLMSELYKRLRPHAIWSDIQYSVRGDVRRFLKLQIGGNINPQFVFSSGQRRATGLAFLLSVNLSIAWSRWRSLLLDDPVQHVDDFRAVHLAEVLAHLCGSGRQIICAVEDVALADMLCRRLPSSLSAPGKRLTLGTDRDGAVTITREHVIAPYLLGALVPANQGSS